MLNCLFDLVILFTVSRNSFVRKNILENGIKQTVQLLWLGTLLVRHPRTTRSLSLLSNRTPTISEVPPLTGTPPTGASFSITMLMSPPSVQLSQQHCMFPGSTCTVRAAHRTAATAASRSPSSPLDLQACRSP